MGELTVFKMNEYDWVAANTEETAKAFYAKEYGIDREKVDEQFEGSVSLNEKMWVEANTYTIGAMVPPFELKSFGHEMWAAVTFEWVIEQMKELDGDFPCVIASTEY